MAGAARRLRCEDCKGTLAPKRHRSDRSMPPTDASKTACVALVPFDATREQPVRSDHGLNRPDPRFVAHLIAMAELSPQTRQLRRAAPAVAQAAYRSQASRNAPHVPLGSRTRQLA